MKNQIKLLLGDYILRSIIVVLVVSFVAITNITINIYDARSVTAILTYYKQYFSVIMLGYGFFLSIFLGKEYESGTIYQLYVLEGKKRYWVNKIVIGILFILAAQLVMFLLNKLICHDWIIYEAKINIVIFMFVIIEAICIILITCISKSSTSGIVLSIIVFFLGMTPLYFISPLKLFLDYVNNVIILS